MVDKSLLSQLPGVDVLLAEAKPLIDSYGHTSVSTTIRDILSELRQEVLSQQRTELPGNSKLLDEINSRLSRSHTNSLTPVINLTGTVLHTNLGRAPLPKRAIDAVRSLSTGFSNLEYDLKTGKRGDRDTHIESLITKITGAEAATIVNNNAAAVLLTLTALAKGREVPVSRGELVEIGGSFRIPEIIAESGCRLIEIGTTNRTHPADYVNAITPDTALLLKVHTSNYEIRGFTQSVSDAEVGRIANKNQLPFVTDLGSGSLVDLTQWGLPYEPTVQETLNAGADIITFSGDKLLGGPQCGLIVGKRKYIQQIKSQPLKRALRVDKMTLTALFEVLKLYLNPAKLTQSLPTLNYLTLTETEVRTKAESVLNPLITCLGKTASVKLCACESQIGSGSLPTKTLASAGIKITPGKSGDESLQNIVRCFRNLPVPVIGRVHDGSLYFDLRTLDSTDVFIQQLDQLTI